MSESSLLIAVGGSCSPYNRLADHSLTSVCHFAGSFALFSRYEVETERDSAVTWGQGRSQRGGSSNRGAPDAG